MMAGAGPHPDALHGLTARELELLALIVEGCSNGQIARILAISRRTGTAHVEHTLAELHRREPTPLSAPNVQGGASHHGRERNDERESTGAG